MRNATIYNFLLESTLMASVAILLMVVIRRFFRRPLGSRVICFAWLLVALRLLCPLALPNPAINEIRPTYLDDEVIRPIAGQIQVRLTDAAEELSSTVSAVQGTDAPVARTLANVVTSLFDGSLSHQLMVIYVIGAGVVLLLFAVSNLRFRWRLRTGRIEEISGTLREKYCLMCMERGVKAIPVYFTDPLSSACLVGVFRPYIALPLTASPQGVLSVLTHEACHYKAHDHLWNVVRLLCCVVHWFNPLVWMAATMSRTDSELACDDRVVAGLDRVQRHAYAGVLVLAASKRNAPGIGVLATGMTMTGKRLRERVNTVLRGSQTRKGAAVVFVLLSCMALVGAFATAEYNDVTPAPNQPDISVNDQGTSEAYVQYAKALWAIPELNMDTASASWRVSVTGNRVVLSASSNAWSKPLLMDLFPDGQHIASLSNPDSGYLNAVEVTGQSATVDDAQIEEIAAMLLRFMEDAAPGWSNRINGFRQVSESLGSHRFVTMAGHAATSDTDYLYVVQVEPDLRIVAMSVGQAELATLAQEAGDLPDGMRGSTPEPVPEANTPVLAAKPQRLLGFVCIDKYPENMRFSPAPADALSLTDALQIAIDSICARYGETAESMQRFMVSYGYRDNATDFATPYWQFDFSCTDPQDSYEIIMHSPDGEVLYIAGVGEGNG